MPDRTYSKDEVAALFERAAELQASAKPSRDKGGLTLEELEHIAAEAGLDPALLRRAAVELDEPARPLRGRRSGTTASHVYTERWVDGTLSAELWEDVVAELRHRFDTGLGGSLGMASYGVSTTEQVGRTVEWKHTSLGGVETRVLMQPHDDQVRIRLNQRVGWGSTAAEAALYGGLVTFIVGMLTGVFTTSFAIGALVGLLTLLAAVPLIYVLDTRWRQKKHRELEELADWIAEHATRLAPRQPSASTAERVAPAVEPALRLEDAERLAEPDDLTARPRRRTR